MPTLIFKPTEACNSRCLYCDVVARRTPWCDAKRIFLEEYFEPITGVKFTPAGPGRDAPDRPEEYAAA